MYIYIIWICVCISIKITFDMLTLLKIFFEKMHPQENRHIAPEVELIISFEIKQTSLLSSFNLFLQRTKSLSESICSNFSYKSFFFFLFCFLNKINLKIFSLLYKYPRRQQKNGSVSIS